MQQQTLEEAVSSVTFAASFEGIGASTGGSIELTGKRGAKAIGTSLDLT
ncbi:MAG: hypothetical protein ACLQU1_31960 [Bryobacteraceae bacterium]